MAGKVLRNGWKAFWAGFGTIGAFLFIGATGRLLWSISPLFTAMVVGAAMMIIFLLVNQAYD